MFILFKFRFIMYMVDLNIFQGVKCRWEMVQNLGSRFFILQDLNFIVRGCKYFSYDMCWGNRYREDFEIKKEKEREKWK